MSNTGRISKGDTASQNGFGFPTLMALRVAGTITTAKFDQCKLPPVLEKPYRSNRSAGNPAAFFPLSVEILEQTVGTFTTPAVYALRELDSAGNTVQTIATMDMANATSGYLYTDLVRLNTTAVQAGNTIKLVVTSIGSGGGSPTTAADVSCKVWGEVYGVSHV